MQPESTSGTKGVQDKQNHPPFPKVPLINPQCCHLQLQLAREEQELCPRGLAPTAPSLLLRKSQLWEMVFSAKMFCGVFWGWLAEFSQQNRLIQSPARRSPSEMDGFDPTLQTISSHDWETNLRECWQLCGFSKPRDGPGPCLTRTG